MQISAFASLIVLALVLVVACFTIGNPWIGGALLMVLGAFAYNHLRFTRAPLHVEHWWVCLQLRAVERALVHAHARMEQAQGRFDFVGWFDADDEVNILKAERGRLVARVYRLDFELEH